MNSIRTLSIYFLLYGILSFMFTSKIREMNSKWIRRESGVAN